MSPFKVNIGIDGTFQWRSFDKVFLCQWRRQGCFGLLEM